MEIDPRTAGVESSALVDAKRMGENAVMTTTEVAQKTPQFREIAALVDRLKSETEVTDGELKTDVLSIMENILNAESEEEVFERQEAGTVASKDYLNRVFLLDKNGIEWKVTAPAFRDQGAFPFYALLRATDAETEKEVVVSCGGASCVAVLDKLSRIGSLDKSRALMFVEKPVSSGFSVILLRPVNVGKRAQKN